jgi:hypothetical protein
MLGTPALVVLLTAAIPAADVLVIPALVAAIVGGFVLVWSWWSVMVPKWHLWAYRRVNDIAKLKAVAVAVGLTWPDGHFFERTELKSSEHAAEERELERRGR